jgi:hypothetical protein
MMTTTYATQNLKSFDIALAYRDGQTIGSYRAALLMDEDGNISVDLEHRPCWYQDRTPMDEWERRTLVWVLPRATDAAALEKGLASGGDIRRALERVHTGHTVEWYGSGYKGVLSRAAQGAVDELIDLLDALPDTDWVVWDAADWVAGVSPEDALSEGWRDKTDDEIAKEWEGIARDDMMILYDTAEAVAEVRLVALGY